MASLLVTLLAILLPLLRGLAVSPGKYCRLPDLDCMLISTTAGLTTSVEYHTHSIETKSEFSPSGELTALEVHWNNYHHSHGSLRPKVSSFFSFFTALNETHLIEACGANDFLWVKVSDMSSGNKLVEIAILTKKINETIIRNDEFINHAFTGDAKPPVYYWTGVYGIDKCPTNDVFHIDQYHSASKIIGIVLAHYRVWQEFYRRYKDGDPERRILILEADVHCSRRFCGDIAIEHINRTDKDFLFIGWCRARNSDMSKVPVCAHAYAISVRAAKVLIDNIFPCVSPVDDQVVELCNEGKLTWATVGLDEIQSTEQIYDFRTSGLIRQIGW